MVFHRFDPARLASSDLPRTPHPMGDARKARPIRVNPISVVWATLMIVIFIGATFVAHARQFAAAETAFLNLTVSLTSAAAGVFVGERLALR